MNWRRVTDHFAHPAVSFDDVLEAYDAADFCADIDNAIGLVTVRLDELVPTQWHVDIDHVAAMLRRDVIPLDGLAVAHIGGRLYLYDGHHRAVAAILRGEITATATEFFDVDAYRREAGEAA